MRKGLLALFIAIWMVPVATYAAPITFDFGGGSSSTNGWRGNERVFTAGGITLRARAYSFHDAGTTGYSAYLGHYSNGLGVTNCDNRSSNYCYGESHVVDNGGLDYDYVRFIFDQPVIPDSVKLRVYNGVEGDISYLLGDFTSNSSSWSDQEAGSPPNPVTVLLNNTWATTSLRLGAQFGETNDDFKIMSLTVNRPGTVPEPGVLGLLSLGLLGVMGTRRRSYKGAAAQSDQG